MKGKREEFMKRLIQDESSPKWKMKVRDSSDWGQPARKRETRAGTGRWLGSG